MNELAIFYGWKKNQSNHTNFVRNELQYKWSTGYYATPSR